MEVVQESGEPVEFNADSSMGSIQVSFFRTLLHTTFPKIKFPLICQLLLLILGTIAPRFFLEPGLVEMAFMASTSLCLALLFLVLWKLVIRSRTTLNLKLQTYEHIRREDGHRKTKEVMRGPSRGIRVWKILDLYEHFQALIRDRNMYYLDPNIIRPLTASVRLSFSELVGPDQVEWFVSHWWGTPVLRSEESAEYQALRKRLDAVEALRAEEAAEQEALEQRLEAVESKDVKEAADAAASKAAARAANKTRLKVKRFAKAHDHKCGHQGLLPNGEPAQCNPKSDAPCCSPGGWCGGSADHCSCSTCIDYRITAAAPAEPYNLEAPKRIAIVVPFRDRGAHLEKFRERIQSHISAWIKKGINHSWKVFVVEQFDEQLFNRGYLFNVGFQFASSEENTLGKFDCVVMHDIDILPFP
eukprot:g28869.t1